MNSLRPRLTYANVMSTLAVVLALGGTTAFAASKIGSGQLKSGAVKSGKIAAGAVTTAKIENGAVTGAKVKDGSLTGADINLGTLGTVPKATSSASAATAQNAINAQNASKVGGQSVASFSREIAPDGPEAVALQFGGVRLDASCKEGKPMMWAVNVSGMSAGARYGNIEESTARGDGQPSFSYFSLIEKPLGQGTLEVVFATGTVTSIDYAWRNDALGAAAGSGCRFFGHVIAG
jgi:hypothetical protein